MQIMELAFLIALYLFISSKQIDREMSYIETEYDKRYKEEGGLFKYKGFVYVSTLIMFPIVSIMNSLKSIIKNRDTRYNFVYCIILALISIIVVQMA